MKKDITHARLLELLSYDPATGVFIRRTSYSNVHAGDIAGSRVGSKNYWNIHIELDGGRYLAHRLAWFYVYGEWPVGDIDHKDTNSCNNAIGNLRLADKYQNNRNVGLTKSNTSGVKGVCWDKSRGVWKAYSSVGGKKAFVGRYDDIEAARNAVKEFRDQNHGEFANHG